MVRNPVRKDVVYDVSLDRKDVDCIVFMTKDPRPMEKHLNEILSRGHEVIFQVTVNPYGKEIEPNVPDTEDVIRSFRRLSERIGRERMLWRYDPVIFGGRYDADFHRKMTEHIASELEGCTERCIFSFLSSYEKIGGRYASGELRQVSAAERRSFLEACPKTVSEHGIRMTSCCIEEDLTGYGLERRGCLDRALFSALNIPYEELSSPIRDGCLCVRNIDIGSYDTCMHDCIYCYANGSDPAERRTVSRRIGGPMLCGELTDSDTVVRLGGRVSKRITDY